MAYDPADFVQCSEFFYNAQYPQQGWAQWRSTYYDLPGAPGWVAGSNQWTVGQWETVDLSDYISIDAKVVFLDYILVLTPSATVNSDMNMTFSVRNKGAGSYINKAASARAWLNAQDLPSYPDLATADHRYPAQAATGSAVNPGLLPAWPNIRQPGHLNVPVTNAKFEIYYTLRNPAVDGSNGWYGINLTVGGYAR